MKVAVIIVNYNDIQDTVNYVQKIKKYEVINRIVVVDNLSTTIGAFENLKKIELPIMLKWICSAGCPPNFEAASCTSAKIQV